jgi:hypothetical protein
MEIYIMTSASLLLELTWFESVELILRALRDVGMLDVVHKFKRISFVKPMLKGKNIKNDKNIKQKSKNDLNFQPKRSLLMVYL